MAHPLLIALALLIAFSDSFGAGGSISPLVSAVWTLAPLASAWLVALAVIRHAGKVLDRTGSRLALMRAESVARGYSVFLYLQAGIAFFAFGWMGAVRTVIGDLVFVDEAVAALPFLLALVGGWWSFAPIERRLIDATLMRALDEGTPVHAPPSAGQIVTSRVRHVLVIGVIVISIVLAWAEITTRLAAWLSARGAFPNDESAELLTAAAQLLVGVPILLCAPILIRLVWDTVPLIPGALADRIASIAGMHGVRFQRVLIWRTRGAMLNGAVVGFLPALRYVLLTDALIERLEERELDAVIAHEIAHVKRRHLPWILAGTGVAAACAGVAVSAVFLVQSRRTGPPPVGLHDAASLGASALAGILAFGMISRRFERQADAFAVQTLSREEGSPTLTPAAVAAMSGALRRVASFNHIRETRFGFRHGSIATRVRNLQAIAGIGAARVPVDRTVRRLKIGVLVAGAAVIGAIGFLSMTP